MCGQDHVARSVKDTVVGVGGTVIEELVDGVVCRQRCRGLLRANSAESNEEFVIHRAANTEECADNLLNTLDTRGVKRG